MPSKYLETVNTLALSDDSDANVPASSRTT